MKIKIEDLRVGDSVGVEFTAVIEKLEIDAFGHKTIRLRNKDGMALIEEGHLAEVPTPEDLKG